MKELTRARCILKKWYSKIYGRDVQRLMKRCHASQSYVHTVFTSGPPTRSINLTICFCFVFENVDRSQLIGRNDNRQLRGDRDFAQQPHINAIALLSVSKR